MIVNNKGADQTAIYIFNLACSSHKILENNALDNKNVCIVFHISIREDLIESILEKHCI